MHEPSLHLRRFRALQPITILSRGASAWMQRSKGQVQKMDATQDAAIVHQALREFGLAS